MNKWIEKSIKLAKSEGYLDKLLEIYPPEEIKRGKIVEDISPNLKTFFQNKDSINLIKELVHLKKEGFKFPIENPYISFLCHYEDAIDKNPKTIEKICEKIFEMNYNELKQKLESPKKASRRIGPMFKEYLKNNFKFVDIEEFEKSYNLVFLKGGDKFLKEYAKNVLKCKFSEPSKGLDFVAKIKNRYIIGTAKFITDFGGSQDNSFMEAIRFVKETKCPENVVKVAIIDGVYLRSKMYEQLELENNEFCFSSLLLNEFLMNFTTL
ncbi:MAG: hypothetical protein NC922_03055 [Candidatus Omnitrophica bacterium]|nr:hypothetical protein [Candidatus Omnitrophota bacterium]